MSIPLVPITQHQPSRNPFHFLPFQRLFLFDLLFSFTSFIIIIIIIIIMIVTVIITVISFEILVQKSDQLGQLGLGGVKRKS